MIRLGAVAYLNARPLVQGLDQQSERFSLRFDVPSKCASLLHGGSVDLGLIPSIEVTQRPDYHVVPDVAITSNGRVASVAVFADRPITAVRSIAVDSSSRTSVALLRVLCAQSFDIEPKFVTMQPDIKAMLKRCDAALLIGDGALFTDHDALGIEKTDLGEEWTAMTDLPFVWAFWAGRPGVATAEDVAALGAARDAGVAASDAIATEFCEGDEDKVEIAVDYLRDNIAFTLDDAARAGLKKFLEAAKDQRVVQLLPPLKYYEL
jgi:chorismate dehydratase